MEDSQIIDLYWERSQDAITQTRTKYGRLLVSIALRILKSMEDAEECESDTYLRAWESMPPQRPSVLAAFLGRITRNLSLDRYDAMHAQKRGGSQVPLLLDELEECIGSGSIAGGAGAGVSQVDESVELRLILNRFLESQTQTARKIFVRRYWFGDSVRDIADAYDMGESRVKMTLMRTRNALREFLQKEGVSV